jgi:hypothetical protein
LGNRGWDHNGATSHRRTRHWWRNVELCEGGWDTWRLIQQCLEIGRRIQGSVFVTVIVIFVIVIFVIVNATER